MSIKRRGVNTYLIRVYLGRDALTGKRIEINETVNGNLAAAKKVEAKLKGQKDAGELIKTSEMTLNKLLDLYLNSARHLQEESTQDKDRKYLNYYVRCYLGSMPLKKITANMIQEWIYLLMDEKRTRLTTTTAIHSNGGKGLAPNTVKTVMKVLSAAFNYAVKEKLIVSNPAGGTRVPSVRASTADSLSIEEANAFVSVKDLFWYGNAFVFQLHTGLRPQELMALIWEDVDFEQGTLRIERACKWMPVVFTGFGPTKCKRSDRIIGLAPAHLDLLRAHFEQQQKHIEERSAKGEPYGEPEINKWVRRKRAKQSHLYAGARLIFPKPDGMVPNNGTPRLQFKEMLQRAGIAGGQETYRWYDLRHTHATLLLIKGVPDHEVAARMGHSLLTLWTTYAHHLKSMRNVAATLFAELIDV